MANLTRLMERRRPGGWPGGVSPLGRAAARDAAGPAGGDAGVPRLCLTGPECTGKTVLAGALARELGTVFVPEFAREYAEAHGNVLTAADVEPIARGQMASEDGLIAQANGILILDTDLLSTVVYARHYYGACPAWIEEEARRRRADLYLLLDTDVPWTADAVRDVGGADAREDLFDAFRRVLDEFETRWEIVSGPRECALIHVKYLA